MPYVRTIPYEEAHGELNEAYDTMHAKVMASMKLFAEEVMLKFK